MIASGLAWLLIYNSYNFILESITITIKKKLELSSFSNIDKIKLAFTFVFLVNFNLYFVILY